MCNTTQEEYISLKGRLQRQLDNYGLRNKASRSKHPLNKVNIANSSKLFLIKERQPVCQSTNQILQICLEASVGDSDGFRELVLNKKAMKENPIVTKREHLKTTTSNFINTLNAQERLGRSLSYRNSHRLKRHLTERSPIAATERNKQRVPTRLREWVPSSKAIGIATPNLLMGAKSESGLRRVSAGNKKYEALKELNKKMVNMWKLWMVNSGCEVGDKSSRTDGLRKQKELVR